MLELLYKRALVAAKAWASHYPKRFKINNEGKGDIIHTRQWFGILKAPAKKRPPLLKSAHCCVM